MLVLSWTFTTFDSEADASRLPSGAASGSASPCRPTPSDRPTNQGTAEHRQPCYGPRCYSATRAWALTIGGVRILSVARADKPLTIAAIAAIAWASTLPAIVSASARRSVLAFYVLAAFAMWSFTLGPSAEFLGQRALYQAPYGWLARLPGFDALRVPARFWMMALVCLSALAAIAVNRFHGRNRGIVVLAAASGLVLDGWPRTFLVVDAPERRPSPPAVAARLDLPLTIHRDSLALYQQMFERVPLHNGFSGHSAPHYHALEQLLAAHDPRILQALTAAGPLGVVIDHSTDADGAYRAYVMSVPGVAVHEVHHGWSSYRLPANTGANPLPDASGAPLRIKALSASVGAPYVHDAIDGSLKTRWTGGVQRLPVDFTIELEQRGYVRQVVTALGPFSRDFPIRLRVDVSADGARWETVFEGDTALHTYFAGLRHAKDVPLVFRIDRGDVRFIKLSQLGSGQHDWSIAELSVLR
jgi:hypothetical protein